MHSIDNIKTFYIIYNININLYYSVIDYIILYCKTEYFLSLSRNINSGRGG